MSYVTSLRFRTSETMPSWFAEKQNFLSEDSLIKFQNSLNYYEKMVFNSKI